MRSTRWHKGMKRLLWIGMLLAPQLAHAQTGGQPANPVVMVIVLGVLSLAPFIVVMMTSFVKISVVLSILRNALGTQQVPPNQIITGLAFVLTIFIMVPVGRQMYDQAGVANTKDIFSEASIKSLFDASKKAKEPFAHFLSQHSSCERPGTVHGTGGAAGAQRSGKRESGKAAGLGASSGATCNPAALAPHRRTASTQASVATPAPSTPPPAPTIDESKIESPDKDDFQVLIPAFVTSQLKEAFEVGFLLFVPFIVVDMVVANILLAMGMQMLSPSVISLPFKLLLFVVVDGWFLIVRGLVLSYM